MDALRSLVRAGLFNILMYSTDSYTWVLDSGVGYTANTIQC
jgi:hypothetical protein